MVDMMTTQEEQVRTVRLLSHHMLRVVRAYQKTLVAPGREAVLAILDAMSYNVAVMIARLPPVTRRRLRDYFISRMDESIAALKDTPVRTLVGEDGEPTTAEN
jgi:hypothetical protein